MELTAVGLDPGLAAPDPGDERGCDGPLHDPEGAGAMRAMQGALAEGGVNTDQVQYINAHGTSTPQGDKAETCAIKSVFGPLAKKVAVSSTKSQLGHLLGASGGVEFVISVLALLNQVAPPTINLDNPDPDCDLDYIPGSARQLRVRNALSNSLGFGGSNSSLVLRHPAEVKL